MFEDLVVGNGYSKKDLSEIFDNPNISIVREGIYNVSDSESFFFVDLEKKGKEERFHFDDFFGYGEASPLPFFSNENMKQVERAIEELKAVLVINHQYNVDELLNIFKVFSKDCPSLNFALDVALYDILSQRKRVSISKYLNKNAIDKINFSAISFEGLHLNQSIK